MTVKPTLGWAVVLVLVASCAAFDGNGDPAGSVPPSTTSGPPVTLRGRITASGGSGLEGAVVSLEGGSTISGSTGTFRLADARPGVLSVERHGWRTEHLVWDGMARRLDVEMEPRIVRGLRVSRNIAADPSAFDRTLELAASSTVNTLVFDTKDESGQVLYDSQVAEAREIGAAHDVYDPRGLLLAAEYADLYTITRIVTFKDDVRAAARPELAIANDWIDPSNEASWDYPIALGEEACRLGFDEVQFDYVRFPATAHKTQEFRTAAIAGFLETATERIHDVGCPVSADIFAIVMSAENDQGIGQMPETMADHVDAISPMIYPSHYSDGWLGYADPNDYPSEVVGDALDDGVPRFGEGTVMRPWLQAFYYDASEVLAGIQEAEQRGHGWILWNAVGRYEQDWLPPAE